MSKINKINEKDKKIFYAMYNFAQERLWLKKVTVFFGKSAHYIFFTIYGFGGIYLLSMLDIRLFPYCILPMAALFFNVILRKIFKQKRPFAENNVESLIDHKGNYSFPSNHAMSAAVISLAVMYIEKKFGIIMIPLAVITGLSRIMSGVHYPKDVIVGWLLGGIIGAVGFL